MIAKKAVALSLFNGHVYCSCSRHVIAQITNADGSLIGWGDCLVDNEQNQYKEKPWTPASSSSTHGLYLDEELRLYAAEEQLQL